MLEKYTVSTSDSECTMSSYDGSEVIVRCIGLGEAGCAGQALNTLVKR